ncbi:protein MON2 homolog isoform X2 [Chrysoperla carnea]|uniref:protein MON2 homolog isoform X2 n=1 Tax=Chrysoperla carnea TaxID=189513 RepID=UPI001D0899C0|nr:protein MON2 homolog isoform X2 [Chrysoperla carnea]
MAYDPRSTHNQEVLKKFIETLQNDFKNLSSETKKKYPQIRESCEEAINKLRCATNVPRPTLYAVINQILYPLVQGCESKDLKIIKFCLGMMQRLITHQVIDQKGARYITDTLWTLMESGTEEVKILQSVTLLLTTNTIVHGETLAKTLVLCFRLHFTRNSTTINTAGATVRQLVSLVFERVVVEDNAIEQQQQNNDNANTNANTNMEELKVASGQPPKGLQPCAADAYLMFQDLVQLVNADQPYWLIGMTEMTRTFGLELLESVLANFAAVFYKHPEFSFLLKERVCALVIKLFSPNIKYRSGQSASLQHQHQHVTPLDKPYFPISMRLLRVVSILIQKYHSLLITECEIFLSLIVKFLDPDKPSWQRALALEMLHRMTVQPELLKSFCECYDLKAHATNIFQDIVNSLGTYVQSLFLNPQLIGSGQSGQSGHVVGPGVSPQRGFFSRGIWLPVVVTFAQGQAKSTYLEMLDKIEPPPIPDGYGISIAYACLLDIIRSLSIIIQGVQTIQTNSSDDQTQNALPMKYTARDQNEAAMHAQLINSSWCGLLAALCPLIDACTDEQASENVLKAMQTFASLCGMLDLRIPRDAFITAICKASLPPHYALTVLNTATPPGSGNSIRGHSRSGSGSGGSSQDMNAHAQYMSVYNAAAESDFRPQIVVVGTPLPTSSLPIGAHQGPVMLTNKNLQCMRALLVLAHCHGSILGTAWHLVLATLQHLVWILGLKPSTGGSLKAGRPTPETNAVITNAVMADLPVLSVMLSRLFESSQYLDDVALHHLIDALCKLSHEAMELACSNREPSLFAVAKLLETGLVNLPRVEVLWRPLTNHLLEVCHHPHIRMREWGVEAITYLVKAALQYKYSSGPLKDNQKLQTLLLSPLSELSSVPHGDVRQRQLECVLQVLHGTGESLTHGWPLVLGIIGAVSIHQGESLIRVAFQCLQLVVTDFLPIMPWRCLPQCVDTVNKFGFQTEELNISLTAVGLMWNISDYFHQNRNKLSETQMEENSVLPDIPGIPNMSNFDKLWMCLYIRLGDLCVDSRPAVRKSAGQTLFSTITAHGSLLMQTTWQAVVWQVLFPLLDKVRILSSSASNEKFDTGGNILIHHTRNTAQKQWAETQVLTLSGVARVFNTKRQLLQTLPDYANAWALLLEFIEHSALSKNDEVSLAALKSFQEVLYLNKVNGAGNGNAEVLDDTIPMTNDLNKGHDGNGMNCSSSEQDMWNVAWKRWLNIALKSTAPPTDPSPSQSQHHSTSTSASDQLFYIPTQAFLTTLIQIFPAIYRHINKNFTNQDVQQLCEVLLNAVTVPMQGESAPYILSTLSDSSLTPLHDSVLHAIDLLTIEAMSTTNTSPAPDPDMLPHIFKQLLAFSKLACKFPYYGTLGEVRFVRSTKSNPSEFNSLNYIPFGEKSLKMAVSLYESNASAQTVIRAQVLHAIIEALHVPLALKYNCPSSSTWKLAAESLLTVLRIGLPVASKNMSQFQSELWTELANTLKDFLFPKSEPPSDRGLDELVQDEAIDCQIIDLLRNELLPFSRDLPKDFIMSLIVLLNKGSIHSTSSHASHTSHSHTSMLNDCETELTIREEFAKTCFETLLHFSLFHKVDPTISSASSVSNASNVSVDNSTIDSTNTTETAGRLAITTLLHRFKEVIKKFNEDELQSGKCPLPRFRLSEISFVLKAITTLVGMMKQATSAQVSPNAWDQLIDLYPHLVECTTTSSLQVSRPLRDALLQYRDLLQPPTTYTLLISSNNYNNNNNKTTTTTTTSTVINNNQQQQL